MRNFPTRGRTFLWKTVFQMGTFPLPLPETLVGLLEVNPQNAGKPLEYGSSEELKSGKFYLDYF